VNRLKFLKGDFGAVHAKAICGLRHAPSLSWLDTEPKTEPQTEHKTDRDTAPHATGLEMALEAVLKRG